jgi:putative transposase
MLLEAETSDREDVRCVVRGRCVVAPFRVSELRQRGVRDILVLCTDGLAGLPEAVEASFPATVFQTYGPHKAGQRLARVATHHRARKRASI